MAPSCGTSCLRSITRICVHIDLLAGTKQELAQRQQCTGMQKIYMHNQGQCSTSSAQVQASQLRGSRHSENACTASSTWASCS